MDNDSIGPSIYCYLNTPSFTNGDNVNTTPYFVAQVTDKDGINAAGTGIGHDLQLTIDDEMGKTYVLNDNFTFDFGSYTSGTTYYSPDYTPKDETWYGYYDEYGYYNEIDADDGNGIAGFFSSLFGEEAPVTEPPEEAEAPDAV